MARREYMAGRKDKKIFSKTAMKTKKINVQPKLSRGGIRL